MQEETIPLPWDEADWFNQHPTRWIHAQLAAQEIQIHGPIEVLHQRPWSTFARVPTNRGIVYFKAPAPSMKFEAGVTRALATWRPECTTPVLAIEPEQGWLLTADAGMTLRQADPSPRQVEHWVKLLPVHVDLQREMAARVPELLQLAMPDRRLAVLPSLYNALLEDTESLLVGQESGLSAAEHQQLLDLRPAFADWCAELASYGLPETLLHEEVHDVNVLVSPDGRYIFTDWSDSSVGHPFFAMLVTIRAAAHRLKLAEDGPEMQRLRDVYLEPWTSYASRAELVAAYELAYRLAMVNRALSWYSSTHQLPKQHKEPYADSVPGWLQDFLAATPAS